jgi:hypothetical protein
MYEYCFMYVTITTMMVMQSFEIRYVPDKFYVDKSVRAPPPT